MMLYMLIDKTTLEGMAVLSVAGLAEIQQLGKLAAHEGKKVCAPPLEGRSFSKLEKLELQYLYWNTFQETPPEEYPDLIANLAEKIPKKVGVNEIPLRELERKVAALVVTPPHAGELDSTRKKGEKKSRPAKEGTGSPRPSPTTTTGLVWDIADQLEEKEGGIPTRRQVIDACVEEGLNAATASTQYAKWKASKTSR